MKRNPPLNPELLERIHGLRRNATDAERLLWSIIRNRQLYGLKFRRQHPCRGFILDFYCHEQRLAIELDGGDHTEETQKAYDAIRTKIVEKEGIRLVRFWNHEVLNNTNDVVAEILAHVKLPS